MIQYIVLRTHIYYSMQYILPNQNFVLQRSTTNTCSLDNVLKRNRRKMVAPAITYMDLKLNIRTCCGLLWTIFGDHCDYYKELLKIYHILDCKECFMIWHPTQRRCVLALLVQLWTMGSLPLDVTLWHLILQRDLFSIILSRIWRVSWMPSGMQIPFSRHLSPVNVCLSLLWIPLTACHWRVHLRPIGETRLLQWPRPRPQLCAQHLQPPRRTRDIQKSNFI